MKYIIQLLIATCAGAKLRKHDVEVLAGPPDSEMVAL